jgi:hypothetical protein
MSDSVQANDDIEDNQDMNEAHQAVSHSESEAPSVESIKVPKGYTLVPTSVLEALMANRPSPEAPKKEESKSTRWKVMMERQYYLGDIKLSLTAGQTFFYVDGEHILVDGHKYDRLTSFLKLWNGQYGPRPTEEMIKRPAFRILNLGPEVPPPFAELFEDDYVEERPSEQQRVRNEEIQAERPQTRREKLHNLNANNGFRHQPLQHQPIAADELPPRGSPERKAMIHGLSGEAVDRPSGQERPENVSDIKVSGNRMEGSRTVARVPGPIADEAKTLPRQRSNTRR